MFDHENDERVYTYEGDPGDVVYEQDRELRSSGMRVASILTTGAIIFAGLAGGAAFAFTNAGANPAVTNTSSSAPSDPAAAPALDPSVTADPTPSATATPAPTDTASPAPTSQTIAVPPVTFNNGDDGKRKYHKPKPSPVSSPNPSFSAPSFGGGGDDGGDDNEGGDD